MNAEKPLMELINNHLDNELRGLPVFHSVAVRLQQMLVSRNLNIDEMIGLICEDQALASNVLRMANSLYYAGLSKVATIKDAIVRLGTQEIANLTMMASQHEYYRSGNESINRIMHDLWQHSLSCAMGARWLARKTGYHALAPEAFMAGLLHDIGKLALLKILDDIVEKRETSANLSEALIIELLDSMHENVGYRLLRSWNLPESYCTISEKHHSAEIDSSNSLMLLVRLSDLACRKVGKVIQPDPTIMLFSAPEAHYLGLKEIALAELEIEIEDSFELKL